MQIYFVRHGKTEWNIQLYNTEKDEKYNDYNDDSDYSFTTDAGAPWRALH